MNWSNDIENNFVCLGSILCSLCVLTIPLFSDHFTLQTDSSGRGIPGVLNVCRDRAELPVVFYSRQLRGGKLNYTATELECMAVKESVCHFEVYLHGHRFMVQTNHQPLESLSTSTHLNSKLTQLSLYLHGFAMKIMYRPRTNNNADRLLRQAWSEDMASQDVKPSEEGGGGVGRCQITPLTGEAKPSVNIKT